MPASTHDTTLQRIHSDPAICGGRPVVRGTRMRVSDILDMLAGGASQADILDDFDYLTAEDIAAALAYAAAQIDHRVINAALWRTLEPTLPEMVAAIGAGERIIEIR